MISINKKSLELAVEPEPKSYDEDSRYNIDDRPLQGIKIGDSRRVEAKGPKGSRKNERGMEDTLDEFAAVSTKKINSTTSTTTSSNGGHRKTVRFFNKRKDIFFTTLS